MPLSRASLVASALRLSYITIALNGVVGASALVIGVVAHSPATAAFALNALLDSSASMVLVWRFHRERRNPEAAERFERHAQTVIVIAMLAVATYVALEALRAIASSEHAEESILAIALALLSLIVLPWLGRAKIKVGRALPSAALRGDGILTLAAGALAAITLAALFVNSAFGWWWADPVGALVIALALATEGVRVAIRHRFG